MKKVLLLFSLFISWALNELNAQACQMSNVSIHMNSSTVSGGNCIINFDLTFDLQHNNGNKYIWIHIWNSTDYPGLTYSHVPTAAELANTLANVGINNNVTPPVLLSSYPLSGVTVESSANGLTVSQTVGGGTGGSDRFKVSGVFVTVPGGCTAAVNLKADVWSTQSASQNNIQCSSAGVAFVPNDPKITGFKVCSNPRTVSLGIQTTSVSAITVAYKLYKDNGNGIFEPGTNDLLVADSVGPYAISSSSSYSKAGVGYTGNNSSGENASIWVSVTSSSSPNTVNSLFASACSPLPVTFKSFSASRNSETVYLKWETASEQNNRGFYVQRNVGGEWKDIAFVFSRAEAGNSDQALSYAYNDPNNYQAISYYRLLQVDLNGNGKFSEVRTVKGMAQSSKLTLFPNPGTNGKINVMFSEEASPKEVIVYDANGRVVKFYKNVVNNNLMIEQLKPGVYNVQVRNTATQIVSSQKFIIQD